MHWASFENLRCYGVGAIFQDGEGRFSQAISGHHAGLCPPGIVEAVAVREALYWATEHFQKRGVIFTDSEQIASALHIRTGWTSRRWGLSSRNVKAFFKLDMISK
ncbi:uncharacterized protein LOC110811711 [Carica papaya]|uniref:uncharacterized protein LOC110811711 n=1 Tax=Carica papaya TaxID=3649 RepID=UPI000B8CFD73|nr:uncharacterized protein LOC110811711 [Carica papaya]